jgi:hypothetical protein
MPALSLDDLGVKHWQPPDGAASALLSPSTPADRKRRQILRVIEANPHESDRAIARLAGVDHKTVAKLRGQAGNSPRGLGNSPPAIGNSPPMAARRDRRAARDLDPAVIVLTEHRFSVHFHGAEKVLRAAVRPVACPSQFDPRTRVMSVPKGSRTGWRWRLRLVSPGGVIKDGEGGDAMTWTKLPDDFPDDCARAQLTDTDFRVHVEGTIWCMRRETAASSTRSTWSAASKSPTHGRRSAPWSASAGGRNYGTGSGVSCTRWTCRSSRGARQAPENDAERQRGRRRKQAGVDDVTA